MDKNQDPGKTYRINILDPQHWNPESSVKKYGTDPESCFVDLLSLRFLVLSHFYDLYLLLDTLLCMFLLFCCEP